MFNGEIISGTGKLRQQSCPAKSVHSQTRLTGFRIEMTYE